LNWCFDTGDIGRIARASFVARDNTLRVTLPKNDPRVASFLSELQAWRVKLDPLL